MRKLRRSSLRALALLGLHGAELSLLLAGDRKTRDLNREYRGIDKTTDVLSFPMYTSKRDIPNKGEFMLGDVVINLSEADRLTEQLNERLDEIIDRLLIHGILHLAGYDHECGPAEGAKMRKKERDLLKRLSEEPD